MEPQFKVGKEVDTAIFENKDKLILLVFTATWCNPCKQLKKQLYDSSSKEGIVTDYQDKLHVIYIDADTEENSELIECYEVSALPTQKLVKLEFDSVKNTANVKVLHTLQGCDIPGLIHQINEYGISA